MAEELSEQQMEELRQDFYERFEEAFKPINIFITSPQMTCGQVKKDELLSTYDSDMNAARTAKASEMETFEFFKNMKSKYSAEMAAFDEMRERIGTDNINELREQYMKENNFPQDHLARFFNPLYREMLEYQAKK
jgi:uncharacterized glyoxalase superfamily metalloenzyme YdcJ